MIDAPARRGLAALSLAVALQAACGVARAADPVEAADALYGAHELERGGAPLWERLFGLGWPTDARHREMVEFAGGGGAEVVTAYLASGAGARLSDSSYLAARREARVSAGERVPSARDALRDELALLAAIAGYEGSLEGFDPVFLPLRRARPELAGTWDRSRLASWAWSADAEGELSLDALGFALLAEAELAHQVLTDRDASPRDRFLGLVALQVACAQVYELRHALVLDAETNEISATPELLTLNPRRYRYPTVWLSAAEDGRLVHAPTGDEELSKSRLGAQAALLLGLARMAALCGPSGPQAVVDLFAEREVDGRKAVAFDPRVPVYVMEVGLFTFRSVRSLHVSVEGSGRASSTADTRGPGATVTPTDLGLLLMALEAVLRDLRAPDEWRSSGLEAQLTDERAKALRLVGPLSGMIRAWLQNEPGFYDAYDVRTSGRAVRTRSLASQAFAVRGLLATHRVVAKGDPQSPFLQAAWDAIEWLDASMWDHEAGAYVETDSEGERRAPLVGALATLGALREMGLATGDGRFLRRYRQYLHGLRQRGLLREGGEAAPGLLPVVTYGTAPGRQ